MRSVTCSFGSMKRTTCALWACSMVQVCKKCSKDCSEHFRSLKQNCSLKAVKDSATSRAVRLIWVWQWGQASTLNYRCSAKKKNHKLSQRLRRNTMCSCKAFLGSKAFMTFRTDNNWVVLRRISSRICMKLWKTFARRNWNCWLNITTRSIRNRESEWAG